MCTDQEPHSDLDELARIAELIHRSKQELFDSLASVHNRLDQDELAPIAQLIRQSKQDLLDSLASVHNRLDQMDRRLETQHGPYAPLLVAAGVSLVTISITLVGYATGTDTLTLNHLAGYLLLIVAGIFFTWDGLLRYLSARNAPCSELRRMLNAKNVKANIISVMALMFLMAGAVLLLAF